MNRPLALSVALGLAWIPMAGRAPNPKPVPEPDRIIRSEFIFERAPFSTCHASTIAEGKDGLVAAWFGGTAEGHPDVGIWLSRFDGARWTAPVEVMPPERKRQVPFLWKRCTIGTAATGAAESGRRVPCWNPVLHQVAGGPLLLFYKAGLSPRNWRGMMMDSRDGGRSWSAPRDLPAGILGPIKNKPVALPDGSLLCPSSTEDAGWRVHLERTPDLGRTWSKSGPLNDGLEFAAIQPAILTHPGGGIQLLCRSKQGCLTECRSADGGKTWTPMRATALPNPDSGIDALTLADGRHVLVSNPVTSGRTPLAVAVSNDGRSWNAAVVLESGPGEFSYPAAIQTADSMVHVTYTWKRTRIRHVVLDPARLPGALTDVRTLIGIKLAN
jgi:predicted neuraminidase